MKGFRSNRWCSIKTLVGWYFLDAARCHRLLTTMPYFINCQIAILYDQIKQVKARAAPFTGHQTMKLNSEKTPANWGFLLFHHL